MVVSKQVSQKVVVQNDKEHHWHKVDEDDVGAVVGVFVVLQSNSVVCAQENL